MTPVVRDFWWLGEAEEEVVVVGRDIHTLVFQ